MENKKNDKATPSQEELLKKIETLEAEKSEAEKLKVKVEALEAEKEELVEKYQSELQSDARISRLNKGRSIVAVVSGDDGVEREVRYRITREKFTFPKGGTVTADELLSNQKKYAVQIATLIERKSPILVEIGRKEISDKKGKEAK